MSLNSKKVLCFVILQFAFLFLANAQNNPPLTDPLKVFIDAGHGGHDVGAIRGPFKEAEITLKLAQQIKQLSSHYPKLQFYFSRLDDQFLSLEARTQKAQQVEAQLFISLHANTSPLSSLSGMEFYFKQNDKRMTGPPILPENLPLNVSLSEQKIIQLMTSQARDFALTRLSLDLNLLFQKNLTAEKSTIKRAPYYVIENAQMPAALVEIGFISNQSEARLLYNENYLKNIAESLINSLLEYQAKLQQKAEE